MELTVMTNPELRRQISERKRILSEMGDGDPRTEVIETTLRTLLRERDARIRTGEWDGAE